MRDLHELPKFRDGLTYLYLEHCRIDQAALSVEAIDKDGRTPIPAAALAVLMLGPGTAITHAAVKTLVDGGCSLLWCGEQGVRCYAQGGGETRKAYALLRQAALASNREKHATVVLRMYRLRFQDELPDGLTLEQVRGLEGVRMRTAYSRAGVDFGVPWQGRRYDRGQWAAADPINRALSAANACLNGLCHAAIVSAGYSPALGFIHTGKQLSFVYDIADLYKTEVTIPLAFRMTAEAPGSGLEGRVRRECREAFRAHRLLQRIIPDIEQVLDVPLSLAEGGIDVDSDGARPTPLWRCESEEDSDGADGA